MHASRPRPISNPDLSPLLSLILVLVLWQVTYARGFVDSLDVQIPMIPDGVSICGCIEQIHLRIEPEGRYLLDGKPISIAELAQAISSRFSTRPTKTLFVRAHPDVTYGVVINAMDVARGSGVKVIGAALD